MKNKQHRHILKAFLESSIPSTLQRESPNLISVDSAVGGYCTQLIKGAKRVEFLSTEIITKDDKVAFSELINRTTGAERDELLIYYRLVVLVESILKLYK